MRARLVHENIEFKRGRDPKQVLGIGKVAQIKQWFEKWAPNKNYEIDDNFNIYIPGSLSLFNKEVTSLPNNLTVGAGINLYQADITSLPDNLEVGGSLFIENTKITSLPDDLKVKGGIYQDSKT